MTTVDIHISLNNKDENINKARAIEIAETVINFIDNSDNDSIIIRKNNKGE